MNKDTMKQFPEYVGYAVLAVLALGSLISIGIFTWWSIQQLIQALF